MNPSSRNVRLSFGLPLTPVVRNLMWINAIVFVCMLLVQNQTFFLDISYPAAIVHMLGVKPHSVLHEYAFWQPFTYLFLHVGWMHLLMNMLGLWVFGSDVERIMGPRRFLQYYFFTGAGAGLVSAFMGIPTVGASGAIFGLLLAFGMLFPNRTLYIYFIFPIKAKYAVMLFGLIELVFLMMRSDQSMTNYAAHLAGLAFGLLWFLFRLRKFDFKGFFRDIQRNRKKKKFRVISNPPEDQSVKDPYNNHTIH
ncbi:MAG: rhomboid family intramembrane serine protease [Bdellovibrionota bacterium]